MTKGNATVLQIRKLQPCKKPLIRESNIADHGTSGPRNLLGLQKWKQSPKTGSPIEAPRSLRKFPNSFMGPDIKCFSIPAFKVFDCSIKLPIYFVDPDR